MFKYNPKYYRSKDYIFFRHEILRSEEAREVLGPTRLGCFEIPDCEKEPTSNIDCPECVTVSK